MSNAAVVESFFSALEADDVEGALALLADDIAWLNTGLPTARGKAVVAILKSLPKARVKFSLTMHAIEEDGDLVRTERTDVLRWGPLSSSFFVAGTLTVRDGLIVRWDDRYSMREVLTGFLPR